MGGRSLLQGKNKTVCFWKGNEQFSGHFQTNVWCYGGKSFKKFFDTQKKHFSLFWKKNVFLILKKIFALKKFSNFFFNFFFQKSVLKIHFFECQKYFETFFPITFYIFLNILVKKKCPLNCPFSGGGGGVNFFHFLSLYLSYWLQNVFLKSNDKKNIFLTENQKWQKNSVLKFQNLQKKQKNIFCPKKSFVGQFLLNFNS